MSKKRLLFLFMALVLVLGTLSGCGGGTDNGNDDGNGNGDGDGAAEGVKIGINYELTGEVATYGQSCRDGILMAFDEINAAGGIDGMEIIPGCL